ncbi:MAG: chemotaxis response regulator protein-glutamate methylesterase [Oscillospiraceae bacterium]|jgi:two-component system chemotaxis response regulator CheB|nr:chemotaxis response regulator protein-glutamate methylesterase [Oscillospiraceae bacterium]
MNNTIQNRKVRVLIVDDSNMFRATVIKGLESTPNVVIAGEAADAFEARDKINELKPDVLVMDVVMPKMDGLTFLKQLMEQYPLPCIIMSGTANETSAIEAGAAGFIKKPRNPSEYKTFSTILGTKIILAAGKAVQKAKISGTAAKTAGIDGVVPGQGAGAKIGKVMPNIPSKEDIAGLPLKTREGYVVALGASTGGTDALECIIKSFPDTMPPVLVVQHMPPVFTKMYSERLDRCCAVHVKEAQDGDRLTEGVCLIAAGGYHMELKKDARGYFVKCYQGEKVSGHCPSVDVMFTSVADVAGKKAIGALMTGMGADGAKGLKKMHDNGAYTIGQDKDSCVVYGMPMEAFKLGACSEQQPLSNIGKALCRHLTEGWK